MNKTETDEKIRVIIESHGKRHEEEGYTLIASLISLPIGAPMQKVVSLNYGRLSAGDYLSNVVASIVACRKVIQDIGLSKTDGEAALKRAIIEGMETTTINWG